MSTIEDAFTPGPGAPPGPVAGAVAGAYGSADALAVAVEAVLGLGCCSADYDALSDTQVLTGQRDLARLRNLVETRAVWLAKTLAYRSRPELGQQGLAAQQGFLSPDALIQKVTGATKTDARKLVDVGRMLARTEAAEAEAAAAAEEEAARRLVDGTDEGGETEGPGMTGAGGSAGGEPVPLPCPGTRPSRTPSPMAPCRWPRHTRSAPGWATSTPSSPGQPSPTPCTPCSVKRAR